MYVCMYVCMHAFAHVFDVRERVMMTMTMLITTTTTTTTRMGMTPGTVRSCFWSAYWRGSVLFGRSLVLFSRENNVAISFLQVMRALVRAHTHTLSLSGGLIARLGHIFM